MDKKVGRLNGSKLQSKRKRSQKLNLNFNRDKMKHTGNSKSHHTTGEDGCHAVPKMLIAAFIEIEGLEW